MFTKATSLSVTRSRALHAQGTGNHPCIKSALAAGVALALAFGGSAAFAQQTAPAAAKTDSDTKLMDEIVVTAQKREERQIDVPMSITAVSGEQLKQAGISSTGDLQQTVPGLTTVNNGLGFVPVIRGVSSQSTSPGDESNVSTYLDDVYLGPPMAGLFDLADIERVEVLKGPQGTLFGRNATGGAIRIVTRKPQFTPEANFSADYGFNFGEWKLGAFATGPLSERVAGSLSATYRKGDGYIDGIGPNEGRSYGKPDNYLVRGKLLFLATDTLEATIAADSMRSQNNAVASVWPRDGINPFPGGGSISSRPYHYAGSTQPVQLLEGSSASIDVKWDASDYLFVRSITAYRTLDLNYQSDIDRTSNSTTALHLNQYQDNFSQELNFSSPADGTFSWLAGLYYYDSSAGNPFWSVISGDAPNGTVISSFTNNVDTSSYAGFGDFTWNATDRLHVTLGGRYTSETKEFHYRRLLGAPLEFDREKTWTSPTYRFVTRYDLADDANVYLSLSNGFKSGVYDAYSALGIPVEPEDVDALEIGTKVRFNGITYTAAIYDYDYKDIQVSSFATVGNVVVLSLTNAAAAKMRGLELTVEGKLTDHLSFSTGVNLMPKAEFLDFRTAQVTVPIANPTSTIIGQVIQPYDASGSRIPRTPKWTANLRLNYETELWGGNFLGTISGFHSPGFYWQAGNLTPEPSYSIVGLRLGWTDPSDRYTYSVWGTNLTDAKYSVYTVPNIRGDSMTGAQGRQIGIGFGIKL